MPRFPCIQNGVFEGRAALAALMIPFIGDVESAVNRIKSSWQRHPEAFVPAVASLYLETRQPTNEAKSLPLLRMQADLFQLAADSTSVLPSLPRTARYLAAKAHFELCQTGLTNAAAPRAACLANIRRANSATELSAPELEAYFGFAFQLGDYDLARSLIVQWEGCRPEDLRTRRARIHLETAAGALGKAVSLIDQILEEHPDDAWALAQRKTAVQKLHNLLDSGSKKPQPAR